MIHLVTISYRISIITKNKINSNKKMIFCNNNKNLKRLGKMFSQGLRMLLLNLKLIDINS